MNNQLEIVVKENYILGIATGPQTAAGNEKMVADLLEACAEYDINQVVADLTGLVGQPGTLSDFNLANLAVELGLPSIRKVALITTQENLEYTTFFENTAKNRGLNVRAFLEEDKALAWINEE